VTAPAYDFAGIARAEALLRVGRPADALAELHRLPTATALSLPGYVVRVAALLQLEQTREAADAARAGLVDCGPQAPLLGLLASAQHQLGDLPGAEQSLLAALAIEPGDADLLCRYALVCLAAGQVDKADRLLARAAQIDPDGVLVHTVRIQVAYARGEDRRAEQLSREFLAAHPDHAVAHALHGSTAASRGRLGDSYASMRQAVAREPADRDLADAAAEARLWAHPLLVPLRPVARLGMFKSWAIAVGIMLTLRAVGLPLVAALFSLAWFLLCVYSWVVPPLLRRWLRRRW